MLPGPGRNPGPGQEESLRLATAEAGEGRDPRPQGGDDHPPATLQADELVAGRVSEIVVGIKDEVAATAGAGAEAQHLGRGFRCHVPSPFRRASDVPSSAFPAISVFGEGRHRRMSREALWQRGHVARMESLTDAEIGGRMSPDFTGRMARSRARKHAPFRALTVVLFEPLSGERTVTNRQTCGGPRRRVRATDALGAPARGPWAVLTIDAGMAKASASACSDSPPPGVHTDPTVLYLFG